MNDKIIMYALDLFFTNVSILAIILSIFHLISSLKDKNNKKNNKKG